MHAIHSLQKILCSGLVLVVSACGFELSRAPEPAGAAAGAVPSGREAGAASSGREAGAASSGREAGARGAPGARSNSVERDAGAPSMPAARGDAPISSDAGASMDSGHENEAEAVGAGAPGEASDPAEGARPPRGREDAARESSVMASEASEVSDGAPDAPETREVSTGLEGRSAARVRVDGFTVWIEPVLEHVPRDGRASWVIRGRASRNLAGVSSFVPDDRFGMATRVGPRRFELRVDGGHELNTLLAGAPIFLRLEPEAVTARPVVVALWLEARLMASDEARGEALRLAPRLAPIAVRDPLVSLRYRGSIEVPGDCRRVESEGGVALIGEPHGGAFPFDLEFEALAGLAERGDPLRFAARCAPAPSLGAAAIRLAVARVGLTRAAPEVAWSAPECGEAAWTCMHRDPTAMDLSSCGAFSEVAACLGLDACGFLPASPLALTPRPGPRLEAAARAFDDACRVRGAACRVARIAAYDVPPCTEPPAEIRSVSAWFAHLDGGAEQDAWEGPVVEQGGLEDLEVFDGAAAPEARALLTAVLEELGPEGVFGQVLSGTSAEPGLERSPITILFSPERLRVVVISGG